MESLKTVVFGGFSFIGILVFFSVAAGLLQGEKRRIEVEEEPARQVAMVVTETETPVSAPPVVVSQTQVVYDDDTVGNMAVNVCDDYDHELVIGFTPPPYATVIDDYEEFCVFRRALLNWFREHTQRPQRRLRLYSVLHDEVDAILTHQEMMDEGVAIPLGSVPGSVGVPVSRSADGAVTEWEVTPERCVSILGSNQVGENTVGSCYLMFLLMHRYPGDLVRTRHLCDEYWRRPEPAMRPFYVLYDEHILRWLGIEMVFDDGSY